MGDEVGREIMDKELENAARKGDINFLKKKVDEENERGGDFKYFLGQTAGDIPLIGSENILHMGIRYEKYEWVEEAAKLLPSHVIGELLCQRNGIRNTPVHYLFILRNIRFIGLLKRERNLFDREAICKGLFQTGNLGLTALHFAALLCNIEILKLLCDEFGEGEGAMWKLWSLIDDPAGNTPLHYATICNEVANVKFLVDKQPDLASIGDKDGNTLLHVAALQGHLEIVTYLVDKLPGLAHTRNIHGESSFDVACENHKFEVALYIAWKQPDFAKNGVIDHTTGDTLLHLAAMYGNAVAANIFLQKHNDLARSANNSKNTPLHVSAQHCHFQVANVLLNFDPQLALACNDEQETPLCLAIKHSEDVPSIDADDHAEKAEDILKTITLLVEKGSSVACSPDAHGLIPLHRAAFLCASYNLPVVKLILEKCPDAEKMRDNKGNTILHLLIDRITSYEEGRNLLEIPGIYELKSIKNNQGESPLDLAWKFNFKMVRALLEFSVKENVNAESISTSTSLQQQFEFEMLEKQKWMMEEYGMIERVAIMRGKLQNLGMNFLLSQDSKGRNVLHKLLNMNTSTTIRRDIYMEFIKEVLKRNPTLISQIDINGDTPVHILVKNSPSTQIIINTIDGDLSSLGGSHILTSVLELCLRYYYKARANAQENHYEQEPPWLIQNVEGNTPLHEALIINSETTLVQRLLKLDVNIIARIINKRKETPLHILAGRPLDYEQLKDKVIEQLITANEEATWMPDCDGLYPLQRGVNIGNLTTIKTMIKTYPEAAEFQDAEGRTLWHVFVNHSIYLTWRLLKDSKDNPILKKMLEIKDNDQFTPLHLAIKCQRFDHAINFLDFDPNLLFAKDKDGKTPLHLVIGNKQQNDFVKQLMELANKEGITRTDLLKEKDNEGKTPLHLAIEDLDFDLVLLFLELLDAKNMNAFLDIPDKKGVTPSDLLRSFPMDVPNKLEQFLKKPTMVGIRSVWDVPTKQMQDYTNTMGVIAALLVTITFTAAFIVPGGSHSDNTNPHGKVSNLGTPLLLKRAAFHVFMVFDILSMCLSTMVLFCLLWVVATTDQGKSVVLLDFSIFLLLLSFYTTLATFMAGLFATVFPIQHGVAIFTLVLCSFLMAMMNKKLVMNVVVPTAKVFLISWQRIHEPKRIIDDWCSSKSSQCQQRNSSLTSTTTTSSLLIWLKKACTSFPSSPFRVLRSIVGLCSKMKTSQNIEPPTEV